MSTPLKALIQERLRAKMVRRGPDYDLDDDYECDSDRLLRQSIDVTPYDVTSRGEDEDTLRNTGSRESTSRRTSSTQPSYPMRLHTHIDPSAYLVPSQQDDRYYPPPTPHGSNSSSHGDHSRQRYSRYPREQYRDTNVYDQPPRPDQEQHQREQRRRHHRVREQLPPRYEPPSRGGYISRQPSQNRVSVSPWHRSEYTSTPRKSSFTVRSPNGASVRAASGPVQSPSPRVHRKQDYDYPDQFDHDDYTRHRRDTKSALPSPSCAASNSSNHQSHHQDSWHQRQRQRRTWKDLGQDYSSQAAYEMRELSPTRHHDYQTLDKSVRRSPVHHHKHSNQTESGNSRSYPIAMAPSSYKSQREEINLPDATNTTDQAERQSAPTLDMEIVELSAKSTGRTRTWDDIMSPESRLAAKAFVEKRQRRTEKGTPRTMATQRWLEVVDAQASRHEAAAN